MEKTHVLIAPWPRYNDVCGGITFKQSISEPVTEQEANRMQAAIGARKVPVELMQGVDQAPADVLDRMVEEALKLSPADFEKSIGEARRYQEDVDDEVDPPAGAGKTEPEVDQADGKAHTRGRKAAGTKAKAAGKEG